MQIPGLSYRFASIVSGMRSMTRAARLRNSTIGRIWRTFGLQPHRSESLKLSPDRQLVDKIRDVFGLYTKPPTNAVVFSVDKKSQIQALERAQPISRC
jgi:hypothetical protein